MGDVVLLMDENFPRGQWPLARVLEVTSDDGTWIELGDYQSG